ncbi:MAG: competence/damage-inducible protein A [Bacteroidetes bacterium]|nr:competence/damage-inducible protein A [Bacteroidota bacterium]
MVKENNTYSEAGIIVIGNEVLSGETLDTNSQYIGKKLNELGIVIRKKISVPDEKEDIIQAIDSLWSCCNLIIVSGGLGPTNDDITKKTLATYFNSELIFSQEIFEAIKKMLRHRVPVISDAHRNQAYVPHNARVLLNKLGTAAGLLFEKEGKVLIALPGVPYELRGLMDSEVRSYLQKLTSSNSLINKNIKTIGIAESIIAQKIKDIEDSLPVYIKLAYLPSIGQVKLRLTAQNGKDKDSLSKELDVLIEKISSRISEYIYGYGDVTVTEAIGLLLRERAASLSTAESCSGGFIAHSITSVSGSSEYYLGGIIAYSNQMKVKELGVSKSILDTYGAVSQECAEAMAKGARKKYGTSYAISTTGIAGPKGGSKEKPVGTIWLAVDSEDETISKKIVFDRGRIQNIHLSSVIVLNMLRMLILKKVDH